MQDTQGINMAAAVEDVQTSIAYTDGYGRTIQTVSKQLSPTKKDNVGVANFDNFGRAGTQAYMPYAATTNDGMFKQNAFVQDSIFYKTLYPTEQVIYSQTIYDGSPMNLPVKAMGAGNEWSGASRGKILNHLSSSMADSVRYWYIDIATEDDIPTTTTFYLPTTLSVKETTDELGIKSISYTDLAGRTILTKTQEANTPATGHTGWLCTYYVYDEMGKLRTIIPPKATNLLIANSWVITNVNLQGLCYSYFYDTRGRQIAKCIPGKGKNYVAYDLQDRPVLTQDPNLRLTNKWAYVLYDAQSRPMQSGIINMGVLTVAAIQAQAAASASYPSLSMGVYSILTRTFYDDYSFVNTIGGAVGSNFDATNINSNNFITSYNAAPTYAQPLASSLRIRGAVTGTWVSTLDGNNYQSTATYYDNYGRAIQTQQRNHTGGIDVATMQYSYKGTVLRSHLSHTKAGSNAQTHTSLSKFTYDHVGRLLSTTKNIDNLGDKIISQLTYKETGQVETKKLAPTGGAGGTVLHTETFSYNMQGMLTGINAPYVTLASNTGTEHFGEVLSYTSGFTTNQYNGGIAGVQWKNAGDSTSRAYGYTYDNVGRLTRADFTQQNSGASVWANDNVDYTIRNLTYDVGGNILSMTQRGLLAIGGNASIDSLQYSYAANTNRLQKVTDLAPSFGGGQGALGDFKDSTTTADDYAYDTNGNIIKDNNRRLHNTNGSIGTLFNLLDKPDSMAVAGKSCTYYTYDAAGTTLCKTVKDYRTNTVKKYTYVGGFVYLSNYAIGATAAPDTLQYAMFEEGRIRWKMLGGLSSVVFDYMLKDHAGNIRTVITDEARIDDYPAATMGTTTAIKNIENQIYAGLDITRVTKPAGYPTTDIFPIPNANNFVAKVQGNAGGQKIGPSITLKVMKGDKFDFYVSSYYQAAATTNAPIANPLGDIVNALTTGVSSSGGVIKTQGITNAQLQAAFTPNITNFLNTQPTYTSGSTIPLAYVNWVLLDEQFKLVSSTSSFERVNEAGVIEPHTKLGLPITQSGYLYIYVSNITPNIPVYFDNLKVKHIRGALLETNEFYPYGLKMANISYRAASSMTNRYGYNGGNEYEDEGELNYSNTFYRKYDAQIGRFTGVDIKAEEFASLTPYQFGGNNPVMFNDPMGDKLRGAHGERLSQLNAHPMGSEYEWSYDFGNSGGGWGGGNFSDFLINGFNSLGNNQIGHAERNSKGKWEFSVFNTTYGKNAQGTIVLVGGNDLYSNGNISNITTMLGDALSNFFRSNKMNINIGIFSSDLRGGPQIQSIVNYVKENHNTSTPLFVYGYSLGGFTANQAIKILSTDNIRVNLFYAVDASTGPMRIFNNGLRISSNVDRFINVYQTSLSYVGSRGYLAGPIEGNTTTHGLNYEYNQLRTFNDAGAHGQMATDLYQSVLTTFQNQMYLLTHP